MIIGVHCVTSLLEDGDEEGCHRVDETRDDYSKFNIELRETEIALPR